MKAAWINLGSEMSLVDESGGYMGTLTTFDRQIHQQTILRLYDAPTAFEIDGFRMLGRPPDCNKIA